MMQVENKRFPYIDALRGLAMFSVVTGHVWLHMGQSSNLCFQVFNVVLQLPLFFFISGFLYKKNIGWFSWIKSKFCYLVIPALIFLALFCLLEERNFIEAIKHDFKYGYWFTLSLFEFFVIYSLFDILLQKLNINSRTAIVLHLLIAILIYYMSYHCKWMGTLCVNLFSVELAKYYIFFVCGAIVKNITKNKNITANKLSVNQIGGGYLLILVLYLYGQDTRCFWAYGATATLIMSVFSVAFCVQYFKRSQFVENGSIIAKYLVFMGKRSLDIYFIHYFILPEKISFIHEFFIDYPSNIFEYMFCMLIAAVIIMLSLVGGDIIRSVPMLSKWMLGIK